MMSVESLTGINNCNRSQENSITVDQLKQKKKCFSELNHSKCKNNSFSENTKYLNDVKDEALYKNNLKYTKTLNDNQSKFKF